VTVVYVDDEPLLCRVMRTIFEFGGVATPLETFTDPLAALAFIADHDVALILCDYRMPQLTGLELLARVTRPIPFVLVSGDLDVARWTAGNARVTAVVTKPFSPDDLLALVRAQLTAPHSAG
jgi:CheY-like chemotaxis protein